ncbi:flexible cuticle protein 12-like [Leptopilina boulardi]|uniref:flexible cuticle protein 12-like n=1 Tax=Leptopilina boulardi TaxID=63433 RepID=UPI0021F63770|nr:flexible cuticle protein 12-like [Leptopilina boulardi]
MMKLIIVVAALVAIAFGAPQKLQKTEDVVVVKELLHDNIGLDKYEYNFQLSDGQQREESAHLINPGTENAAIVVRGSFSWVDPATNQLYTVTYVADENGFHPEGAHIPSV